jgi:peptidoglycan/LPS O-acetylase OafA/YrhL
MTTCQTNAQNSASSLDKQQLHFTPPKSHRFLFLDALRGIAALFVVAYHFPLTMTSSFAVNGFLAVDFFFCLSGFVIAFSYENRLSETLSFKNFAVARLIRLYPIYALGSLIGLLTLILVNYFVFHAFSWMAMSSLSTLALFLWPACLSPLHGNENYPLNPPAWSLFFEIVANLAYALLIKLRIARTTLLLCIVAGSLALIVSTVFSGNSLDAGGRQSEFSFGLARVTFSFFLGVLICRFFRYRTRKAETPGIQRLVPLIMTLLLIGILNAPLAWMRTESFRLIAISLCFPAMVYYGALARLPRSFTRFTTVLGELSYPLYLLHGPFVTLMRARFLLQFTATHATLVHGFVLCTVAVFALISWQVAELVDLPIRRALTWRYNSINNQN